MDWILRVIKGALIGSGFVLPGISGGALAAVFGIYERIIEFLAHITKNFKKNVLYFIPVGIGGLLGVYLFSFLVSFALEKYQTQMLWFFVGAIVGTVPSLWKMAGKKGRNRGDWIIMTIVFVLSLVFLLYGQNLFSKGISLNFGTWMLAGAFIGLGIIVPGLSPSNFLVYMGMYKPMTDGMKNVDMNVIVPLAIGGILTVLLLAKVMSWILKKHYSGMYHFILGVVFSSTIMIIPFNGHYDFGVIIGSILLLVAGAALGYWMTTLEEKYQ